MFNKKIKEKNEWLAKENALLVSFITSKFDSAFFSNIKNQLTIMKTLADIQADLASLQQSVQAENSVIDSAITLINGFGKMIADLKQQLADALALNDQEALQQVVANMEQLKLDIDAESQTLASSVTANTTVPVEGTESAGSGDNTNTGNESSSANNGEETEPAIGGESSSPEDEEENS